MLLLSDRKLVFFLWLKARPQPSIPPVRTSQGQFVWGNLHNLPLSIVVAYSAWKSGIDLNNVISGGIIESIPELTGMVDPYIGGSSTGVVDGNTAAQVLQEAASEPTEEKSSNEAAIAAPAHQGMNNLPLYISCVILASMITLKLVGK